MATQALHGIKVIEFAGLAPGPFAGLVLADWGASVIRIDRPDQPTSTDFLCRGKRSLSVNLKVLEGRKLVQDLIAQADVLIDPFRPGVLEKLELGPDVFLAEGGLNRRLVYARLSGFPRSGPHRDMAGHDINYLALSGVLSMLPGASDKPSFPLNLLADFAGGGMMCALGILLALVARNARPDGRGEIVEVDMVSGTRYLSSFPLLHVLLPDSPMFGTGPTRGTRILDGGAPFYGVYTCADGKWMSVGCLEPQFFDAFLPRFLRELPAGFLDSQGGWIPTMDSRTNPAEWPRLRAFMEFGFKAMTRDEWTRIFHGTDACVVPVLSPEEAASLSGNPIPPAHPDLSLSPKLAVPSSIDAIHETLLLQPGQHNDQILSELRVSPIEKQQLLSCGALSSASSKL